MWRRRGQTVCLCARPPGLTLAGVNKPWCCGDSSRRPLQREAESVVRTAYARTGPQTPGLQSPDRLSCCRELPGVGVPHGRGRGPLAGCCEEEAGQQDAVTGVQPGDAAHGPGTRFSDFARSLSWLPPPTAESGRTRSQGLWILALKAALPGGDVTAPGEGTARGCLPWLGAG